MLAKLDYQPERSALQEFSARFVELNALNREISSEAALDTNIKAQQLSFGSAQDAANRMAAALTRIRSGGNAQAHAMAGEALAAVREIQVLEAPHIAAAQDAAMDHLEQQMRTEEALVRKNLAALAGTASSRPAAMEASREFEAFMKVHSNILQLSRRNSNVRSLALTLGKRHTLAAQCEERLRSIQQVLEKRDLSPSTR